MIQADLHSHTALSHGESGAAELLQAAEAANLAYFGISEHSPLPEGFACNLYTGNLAGGLDDLAAEILDLSAKAGKTKLLLGLELDWIPCKMRHMRELVGSQPFDYVFGSLHFLDGISTGSPKSWAQGQKREYRFGRFAAYFEEMADMAASGLVNIAAHPDFIKLRLWPDFMAWLDLPQSRPHMEKAFNALATNNVAMEVSSAGLRQDFNEPYPAPALMRLAREMDVRICFGSDAHRPADVANNFPKLAEYARSFGFSKYVVPQKREFFSLDL